MVPHRSTGLPQALQAGLANFDEHAVSALGFELLVPGRSARAASNARSTRWLQRLADTMLSQFSIMAAAQASDPGTLEADGLHGRQLPAPTAARMRM